MGARNTVSSTIRWRAKVAALAFIGVATSCGIISTGSGPLNQVAPSGTIVAQGAFTPNLGSVSGNVAIYQTGTGTYSVFLNSFTGPTTTAGLLLIVTGSQGQVLSTALQASSGNQTYPFSAAAGTTFVQVSIYQTSITNNINVAALTST
jgi:hypothetical protein